MENESGVGICLNLKTAIKQGYLIKFNRGLLKVPKMRYFVLTENSLSWFNYKPTKGTEPLGFLPLKYLTSVKVDDIELNSCLLSCMAIVSRTGSNFLLAFSRREERDEWMMAIMSALGEALVSSETLNSNETMKPKPNISESVQAAVTQLHNAAVSSKQGQKQTQLKRRKRNREQTLRRSKSYDVLTLNDCTNNSDSTHASDNNDASEDIAAFYEPRRKRKSEPDINIISHFSQPWPPKDGQDKHFKEFKSSCFDHRDSVTLLSSKQNKKCDFKGILMSKIISTFDYSTKLAQ